MIPLGPRTSTAGTTYSAGQVFAMVMGSNLEDRWQFDLLGPSLTWKADLNPYLLQTPLPQISFDATRAVPGQLTLTMRAMPIADPNRDFLRAIYQIQAPDGGWLEWNVFTGVFSRPDRSISETYTQWTITASDLSYLLSTAGAEQAFGVPPGASYATAVAQLVASYGGPTPLSAAVYDDGQLLPATQGWDAGKSFLPAINDLLSAVAYTPAFMRGSLLMARPYPDLSTEPLVATFDTLLGPAKVIGPFGDKLVNQEPANIIIVTGQDPRRAPVSGRYENWGADSPNSLANGGRRVVKVVTGSTIPSDAAASAMAFKEAQTEALVYSNFNFALPPWPWFEPLDVVRVVYQSADEGLVNERYVVQRASVNCGAASTTVEAMRVVAI